MTRAPPRRPPAEILSGRAHRHPCAGSTAARETGESGSRAPNAARQRRSQCAWSAGWPPRTPRSGSLFLERTIHAAQASPRRTGSATARPSATATDRRAAIHGLPTALATSLCARLVAVDAQRVGGDGYALTGEAGDVALLDHRQRLLHRLVGVLDHAAGLVARRERAVVGIAAIREYLAADRDACFFCYLKIFTAREH